MKHLKNRLIWVFVALFLLIFAALGVGYAVSRPQFDETLDEASAGGTAVPPVSEALSFARYSDQGQLRLLLVTGYADGQVAGIDLNREDADPIRLFREQGYEAIELAAAGKPEITVPVSALEVPLEGREANIGIGANYREHARESGIEEKPFVFPKLALPTRHDSTVARQPSVLLDYEAELGLVALDDIAAPGELPAHMGLVLCNELTDRYTLVRNYRRGAEMGTTGFVEGKSREGFAVLGPLLVIPRDLEAFLGKIELRLYLNGKLRQYEHPANMVWDARAILAEIFKRGSWTFRNYGSNAPLLAPGNVIPAGSVIFSGTPAGVIFKPANLLNPWVYLRPGDEVVIQGTALGTIRNRIVD